MRIKQAHTQMHQNGAIARANMLCEATTGLIGSDRVCPIDLFSIDTSSLSPIDERPGPLSGGGRSDCPAIILNNQQYGELVHGGLTEQDTEIIGCRAAIAGRAENQFVSLLLFQGEANAASERCMPGHLAKA